MKNTSLRIKILSGMLCTGLALSSSSFAFAAGKEDGSVNNNVATSMDFKNPSYNKKDSQAHRAEMRSILKIVIEESIKSNIITQDEGDKILKYVTVKFDKNSNDNKKQKTCKKGKCDGSKGGLFNDLVTEGILTVEKSDKVREKMYAKRTEIRTIEIKKGLNTLVANKIITMEQSKKVEEVIIEKHVERKEFYRKIKGLSEKERHDYIKKFKSDKVSPMKILVDNGIITKEQETEIQNVLPHHNHGHRNHK